MSAARAAGPLQQNAGGGTDLASRLPGRTAKNHRRDALICTADDEHAVALAVQGYRHSTAHRRKQGAQLADKHVLVLDRCGRIAHRSHIAQDDLPQVAERVILDASLRNCWRNWGGPQATWAPFHA
eukprot:997534-Rhodomonas_salina.3